MKSTSKLYLGVVKAHMKIKDDIKAETNHPQLDGDTNRLDNPAHQGFLWNFGKRGEDINLDRCAGLCSGGDRSKANADR